MPSVRYFFGVSSASGSKTLARYHMTEFDSVVIAESATQQE